MIERIPAGRHAVLAIDPGGTTGIAAAHVEIAETAKATLQGARNRKAIEVGGSWIEQAHEIARIISRFRFTANVENAIPVDHIHVVAEDFVLRRQQQGGATGNLTSIWVMAGAVATASYSESQTIPPAEEQWEEVAFQQPSEAKTFATNDRLKLWGLYEIGSEHKRDAWRHFALYVNKRLVP